jgi:hypothetical protein
MLRPYSPAQTALPTSKQEVIARKVLINLATGLEDPERVTVAFLVGGAALQRGEAVAVWLTKEAVRLALPGHAQGVACDGCPRCRSCSSSTQTVGASCSSVRSASTRESSIKVRWFPMRGWWARPRCSSGSRMVQSSSATEHSAVAKGQSIERRTGHVLLAGGEVLQDSLGVPDTAAVERTEHRSSAGRPLPLRSRSGHPARLHETAAVGAEHSLAHPRGDLLSGRHAPRR